MSRGKGIKILLGIAAATGIGWLGYSVYRNKKVLDNISIKIKKVKLIRREGILDYLSRGFSFIVTISLINDMEKSARYEQMNLKVYLNDVYIGDLTDLDPTSIPPLSEVDNEYRFDMPIDGLPRAFTQLINNVVMNLEAANIRFVGTIDISGLRFNIDEQKHFF